MKQKDWHFWAVWIGLLIVAYFVWTRVTKTASDAATFGNNAFVSPLKFLLG